MAYGQFSRGRTTFQAILASVRAVLVAVRVVLTILSVASVATWGAWLASGRVDKAWPERNRLEYEVRELVARYLVPTATETLPPGSITGKVHMRLPDATPSPTPERTLELAPSPSVSAQWWVTPTVAATVAPTRTALPTSTPAGTPVGTPTARLGPVSGATVLIADAEANVVESTTDSSGAFALSGVDGRRYLVAVSAPGFASVVIDHPATRDPVDRLIAWFLPGILVPWNGDVALEVVLDRQPDAPTIAPREATLVTGDPVTVRCENPVSASAERMPVDFLGLDNAGGIIWKYRPGKDEGTPVPARADNRPRPVVIAVIPAPLAISDCALAGLASAGSDVLAIILPLDTRVERDVRLVRMLIASVRQPPLPRVATSPDPQGWPGSAGQGPFILGAGHAAVHALRAVRDEQTGAIPGLILISSPVDMFAMRRHSRRVAEFPGHLTDFLTGLGPADREIGRYVRYSAQYNLSDVIPPTMIVHHRSDPTFPFAPVARYANTLARLGVPLDTMFIDDGAPGFMDDPETGRAVLGRIESFITSHLPASASDGSR